MTFRIPVECSNARCVRRKSPRAKPSKLGIQRKQYVGKQALYSLPKDLSFGAVNLVGITDCNQIKLDYC